MLRITTTELRTKANHLVRELARGGRVRLVHRSQVIADINPVNTENAPPVDIDSLQSAINRLKKSDIPDSIQERDQLYRQHLEEKYGQHLS